MSDVLKSAVGAVICVGFALARGAGPFEPAWAQVAVLFAALVLVPLALELFEEEAPEADVARLMRWVRNVQLPAAVLLTIACWLERGGLALAAALPWMMFTGLLAGAGFLRLQRGGLKRELHLLAADLALMFSAVGGAWMLADRGGFRPLGFDPHMVALTAVHFHYAGLLLPLVAGLAQQRMWMSRLAARAVVGSVLGVPMVALGITATQRGWNPGVEAAAGCAMALAGMAVAILHVRLALEAKWPAATRALLGVAGVALFFAMVLAALYASRAFVRPIDRLDLPHMQAVHGVANAVGFALCAVLGWRGAKRSGQAAPPV